VAVSSCDHIISSGCFNQADKISKDFQEFVIFFSLFISSPFSPGAVVGWIRTLKPTALPAHRSHQEVGLWELALANAAHYFCASVACKLKC
jgi:hypothetical protein